MLSRGALINAVFTRAVIVASSNARLTPVRPVAAPQPAVTINNASATEVSLPICGSLRSYYALAIRGSRVAGRDSIRGSRLAVGGSRLAAGDGIAGFEIRDAGFGIRDD